MGGIVTPNCRPRRRSAILRWCASGFGVVCLRRPAVVGGSARAQESALEAAAALADDGAFDAPKLAPPDAGDKTSWPRRRNTDARRTSSRSSARSRSAAAIRSPRRRASASPSTGSRTSPSTPTSRTTPPSTPAPATTSAASRRRSSSSSSSRARASCATGACSTTTASATTAWAPASRRWRSTEHPLGAGVQSRPLVPFRSIAVDPRFIPIGAPVYVPELVGVLLPDGTRHDGCLRADDMGGAIKEHKLDFFVESYNNFKFIADNLWWRMKATPHLDEPRCEYPADPRRARARQRAHRLDRHPRQVQAAADGGEGRAAQDGAQSRHRQGVAGAPLGRAKGPRRSRARNERRRSGVGARRRVGARCAGAGAGACAATSDKSPRSARRWPARSSRRGTRRCGRALERGRLAARRLVGRCAVHLGAARSVGRAAADQGVRARRALDGGSVIVATAAGIVGRGPERHVLTAMFMHAGLVEHHAAARRAARRITSGRVRR